MSETSRLEAEVEAAKPERRRIIPICDHCGKPWAGCHGVCAERELSLKDRLEFAIPYELTATAHVGIGGARRAAIAAELLPVVEAEIATRISVLEERIRKVREICGEIECPNCDHPVRFHDNRLGTCEANLNNVLGPCGCHWSSSVAEDIRAALDGEDEERAA